jgi:hypothetical protein
MHTDRACSPSRTTHSLEVPSGSSHKDTFIPSHQYVLGAATKNCCANCVGALSNLNFYAYRYQRLGLPVVSYIRAIYEVLAHCESCYGNAGTDVERQAAIKLRLQKNTGTVWNRPALESMIHIRKTRKKVRSQIPNPIRSFAKQNKTRPKPF